MISFPAISMGNYGMPKKIASKQMLVAFRDWIIHRHDIGKIEHKRICLQDKEALLNFREQFSELFGEAEPKLGKQLEDD
jgi:O-acetyl-ADP-ribose deacetylase (regulator of RNase III)